MVRPWWGSLRKGEKSSVCARGSCCIINCFFKRGYEPPATTSQTCRSNTLPTEPNQSITEIPLARGHDQSMRVQFYVAFRHQGVLAACVKKRIKKKTFAINPKRIHKHVSPQTPPIVSDKSRVCVCARLSFFTMQTSSPKNAMINIPTRFPFSGIVVDFKSQIIGGVAKAEKREHSSRRVFLVPAILVRMSHRERTGGGGGSKKWKRSQAQTSLLSLVIYSYTHVGGHGGVGLLVRHDATGLGVLPAAQEGGGRGQDDVGVLVHADREGAAASLGRVSGALEVAGGVAELHRVVGCLTAEALHSAKEKEGGGGAYVLRVA